jgi:hypothetical protein
MTSLGIAEGSLNHGFIAKPNDSGGDSPGIRSAIARSPIIEMTKSLHLPLCA